MTLLPEARTTCVVLTTVTVCGEDVPLLSSLTLISVLILDVQPAHVASWATAVEESSQVGRQAGETGSSPAIQMDDRETCQTDSFAQQPAISAGYLHLLCCLLRHAVLFSFSLLL